MYFADASRLQLPFGGPIATSNDKRSHAPAVRPGGTSSTGGRMNDGNTRPK